MNKNYIHFEEIVKTMKAYNYDYSLVINLNQIKKRKQQKTFSFEEHLKFVILSLLSNQRRWKQIDDKYIALQEIFHNFDKQYLKNVNPNLLVKQIKLIKCGNRQIKKQMATLYENIVTLEIIEKEFGSIDNFIYSDSPKNIAKKLATPGKYKLKQMGIPLVSEYLKNVGVDIIKPDVHVRRILSRLGYTDNSPATIDESYLICDNIAKEYNITNTEVDSILWQFCADNYFQCCNNNPNCKICLVKNCKYKNSIN